MSNLPIQQLQDLAGDPSSDLVAVLLKAKTIAVKLGDEKIKSWIESEVNGYTDDVSVPDYRKSYGTLKAKNPVRGWIPVDLGTTDEKIVKSFTFVTFTDSISSLQRLSKETGQPHIILPPHLTEILCEQSDYRTQFAWFISQSKIEQVLATVRFKIHDWSLEIDSNGGEEGNKESTDLKLNIPSSGNTYNTIYNAPVNNAVSVASGTIQSLHQQNTINSGDFRKLAQQLESHGLEEADIAELEKLVQESPQPITVSEVEKGFGGWIGNMTIKALKGGLKIAGATAPAVLTNAICQYFGITV